METYSFPVKTWDRTSNTGELMELFHTLRECYEAPHNRDSGVTEEQFEEKRGLLIWGVQREKVTFTLMSDGWLKADFLCDEQDIITENNAE